MSAHIGFRELRNEKVVLCQCLLRLSSTDHIFEDAGIVLLNPLCATIELTTLSSGHDDQSISKLLELLEAFKSARDRLGFVEVVGLVELFDLAKGLFWRSPSWVLRYRFISPSQRNSVILVVPSSSSNLRARKDILAVYTPQITTQLTVAMR